MYGQDDGTIYIVVTPVNDAPVLNAAPRTLPSIDEDLPDVSNQGATVGTLLAGMVTEVDTDALPAGIALVGATGNGTWQYSLDGAAWLDVGTVSITSALTLEPTARIRFRPAANFFGQASITYRAWDRSDGAANGQRGINPGNGGGTSAYSSATATATITVNPVNDPPEITISSNVTITNILAAFNVNGSVVDVEDTTLNVTINFGDGTTDTLTSEDGTFASTHQYQRSGTYTVTVTVRDSANATDSVSFVVQAVNDPPQLTLDAAIPSSVHIFTPFNGGGSFFDTENDSITLQIDFGDGTSEQTITPAPDRTFSFSHQYQHSGQYTMTVTVRDSESTTRTTYPVQVINHPPTVTISAPRQIRYDEPFVGTGSFSDIEDVPPGNWSATVDYGDGSGSQPLVLSDDKRFVLNHSYAEEGTYTITVRVSDREGAIGTASISVRVSRYFVVSLPIVLR